MKTNFVSKISSLIFFVAVAGLFAPGEPTNGADVGVKRGGLEYRWPAPSVKVSKPETTPMTACCKSEFVPTVTQDTKLKTKILLTEQHACKSCSTTIASVGAQKAARKDVVRHTCAGQLVSMNTCCASMPMP